MKMKADTIEFYHQITRQAYNTAAEKYHCLFHNEMNEKEYDRNLLNSFAKLFDPGAFICDAGCGPSGHIGKYLLDKGMKIIGVDISDRCVELAAVNNPEIQFYREDIARMSFPDAQFGGIVAYYSIINTPKKYVSKIFAEFHRLLKKGGCLLIAVKEGSGEGFISELIGIKSEIYFSLFSEKEIREYFSNNGFEIAFIETRNPYDFEIKNERIFAIGKKL